MRSWPGSRAWRRRVRRLATLGTMSLVLAMSVLAGAVWAAYTSVGRSEGNQLVAATDWVAPTVSASVIGKSQGGLPGYIHQGGTYNVYANGTDSGAPPSEIASLTAGLTAITTGQTAAPLSAGTFSIGGSSYGYRSGTLTANATLAAATLGYSLTARDGAANSRVQSGYTVIVDNTAPTAADVQTTDKTGGTAGRPELGDTVVFTFSEPIDPNSIIAGWTGTSTGVVVHIANGTTDSLTVYNAANTTQLPLGSVNLGTGEYVASSATFGATGTASTMVLSGNAITVTLGTASSGPSIGLFPATMTWTPSATAYDRAGNAESTAARTETGTLDREF